MWTASQNPPEAEIAPELSASLYADGYKSGFEAFRAQMGIPMPKDPVLKATYTSSHEGDHEEFNRDTPMDTTGPRSCSTAPRGFKGPLFRL